YTLKGISLSHIRSLRMVQPSLILVVLGFTLASYSLRCVRWTQMMRFTGARFAVCARVLMTSLAANNILPLRIGDVMRIFTYAPDLGASPSVILSTVILEKLLDVFVVGRIFAKLPSNKLVQKLEHWLLLAVDTLRQQGIAGNLLLLLQSFIIWFCEGMIFLSAIRLVGLGTDALGPWEAVSFANLSYMLPSSPGAIGTFEWAVESALTSHGAPQAQAAVFGLAIHAWLLVSITGAGGLIFLIHRFKIHNHKPLLEEIESLPTELP